MKDMINRISIKARELIGLETPVPKEATTIRLNTVKRSVGEVRLEVEENGQRFIVGFQEPECFPLGNDTTGYKVGVRLTVSAEGTRSDSCLMLEVEGLNPRIYKKREDFYATPHNPSVWVGMDTLHNAAQRHVHSELVGIGKTNSEE